MRGNFASTPSSLGGLQDLALEQQIFYGGEHLAGQTVLRFAWLCGIAHTFYSLGVRYPKYVSKWTKNVGAGFGRLREVISHFVPFLKPGETV